MKLLDILLSPCLSQQALQPWHVAGLLQCTPHAGDIDRLLHGAPAVGAVAFHFVSTAANVNSVVFTAT